MKYTYEEKLEIAKEIRNNAKNKPMSEYQRNYIEQVNINECELETRHGKTKYYQVEGENRKKNSSLVIIVHGGGFCKGHSEADKAFASMIAVETNSLILDVDYKLAPEYPFPVAYEEVYDVAKWAYENADKLGVDKSKIILCGSSAGGNIVAAVAMEANRTKEFEIKLQIFSYPVMDLYTDPAKKAEADKLYIPFEQSRKYNSLYISNEEEAKNPYVSMVFATEDMLKGLPDSLFITGGLDTLHVEAEKFAFMLMKAGVKVTIKRFLNSKHAFVVRCIGDEWLDAHKLITKTINNI